MNHSNSTDSKDSKDSKEENGVSDKPKSKVDEIYERYVLSLGHNLKAVSDFL